MEKKKFGMGVSILAVAGIICAWIFAGIVERENNRWLYDVTDSLVSEIVNQYPDVEEKTIHQMFSEGIASPKESVLKKYGMEEDNFLPKRNDGNLLVTTNFTGIKPSDIFAEFIFSEDGHELLECINHKKPYQSRYDEHNDRCNTLLKKWTA